MYFVFISIIKDKNLNLIFTINLNLNPSRSNIFDLDGQINSESIDLPLYLFQLLGER